MFRGLPAVNQMLTGPVSAIRLYFKTFQRLRSTPGLYILAMHRACCHVPQTLAGSCKMPRNNRDQKNTGMCELYLDFHK